jgi:hypothetical protein
MPVSSVRFAIPILVAALVAASGIQAAGFNQGDDAPLSALGLYKSPSSAIGAPNAPHTGFIRPCPSSAPYATFSHCSAFPLKPGSHRHIY